MALKLNYTGINVDNETIATILHYVETLKKYPKSENCISWNTWFSEVIIFFQAWKNFQQTSMQALLVPQQMLKHSLSSCL